MMKIKCQYCGTMINDTLDHCPNCGAPNAGVVRTTKDQPQTIEDLKEWYAARGLPPYETTRFFIGEDYRKPRAFGIYKDEKTGNFVVYKNKDSGERAVRYQGTDEAYAVNELFMRLKQEIIQQKRANVSKSMPQQEQSKKKESSSDSSDFTKKDAIGCLKGCGLLALIGVGGFFGLILIIVIFGFFISIFDHSPDRGYYSYEGTPYYYFSNAENWFGIDEATNDWTVKPISESEVPSALHDDRTGKNYYLSYDWEENLNMPNFDDSVYMKDFLNSSQKGYYRYDDTDYYHISPVYDYGWYEYDGNDWNSVDSADVPEDLKHYESSQDFYYTPDWDSSTQITDFMDSDAYAEYSKSQSSSSSSSSSSDDSSWSNWDDDDDWDWDSGSDWDSDSSDWDSDW